MSTSRSDMVKIYITLIVVHTYHGHCNAMASQEFVDMNVCFIESYT